MSTVVRGSRPRFNEREGRLLLSAVFRVRKADPHDDEWDALYEKLLRHWGDGDTSNQDRTPDERDPASEPKP